MLLSSVFSSDGFDEFSPTVIVTNIFAVCVVLFAGVVTFIMTSSQFSALGAERYDQLN